MPDETTTATATATIDDLAPGQEYITVRDATRLLACSVWTIYSLVERGHLPAYALPGRRSGKGTLRLKPDDVRAVLRRRPA